MMYARNEVMKPSHHVFGEQVDLVVRWFDGWNGIEQTIACYSLLKRLDPTQARFLSLVLEHTFKHHASDIYALEEEANSKEFLMGLCQESKDVAVQQLLLHLPLLHPGNDDARHEYLKVLPKILTHSLEYSIHEEECRQLLSLALVHPAFVLDERQSLNIWLQLLNDKNEKLMQRAHPPPGFTNNMHPAQHQPLTSSKSACELWRTNHRVHQPVTNTQSYRPLAATNSVGPSINHQNHQTHWKAQQPLHQTDSGIGSYDIQNNIAHKAILEKCSSHAVLENRVSRSLSFPVDPSTAAASHQSVSPQSSLDSDEEKKIQEQQQNEKAHPGMKDIPLWLKSLRLHKYSAIFFDLTYDDMMQLDDQKLEIQGVTKGARNKILLSISKLNERSDVLKVLEKDVLLMGKLPSVLQELRQILMTPIKPFEESEEVDEEKVEQVDGETDGKEEPLHSHITRVMGKVCTQILVAQPSEDACMMYLGLLDRVLAHDAFSLADKRRLQAWKAQCQKLARTLATNRKLAGIEKGPKNWYEMQGFNGAGSAGNGLNGVRSNNGNRMAAGRTQSLKTGGYGQMIHGGAGGAGSRLTNAQNLHKQLQATNSYNNVHPQQLHHQQQPVSRTKSAPINSGNQVRPPGLQEEGINQSLETLCLSMTNHALEDSRSEAVESATVTASSFQ